MKREDKIKIFLADDDAVFLKSMEIQFHWHPYFNIETFAAGELCLQNLSHNPDVVILDYHLDSVDKKAMNGMETLDRIKAFNPDIPVVMLSSQDRIEVAVNCMRHGALDYVLKNEAAFARLKNIIAAFLPCQLSEIELN